MWLVIVLFHPRGLDGVFCLHTFCWKASISVILRASEIMPCAYDFQNLITCSES